MSGTEKRIEKLLKIAQNGNELAFQKDVDYMKFKYIKVKSAYSPTSLEINCLIHDFKKLHFQEECLYWYKRLLKITDMCNKEERHEIFSGILNIYITKKKFESILKYCKEALENVKGTNLLHQILEFNMGYALLSLKMYQDALPYFNNENLTYFTNRGEHSLGNSLCFYKDYIDCHMKNNKYSELFETIGKVALCKLNSEEPNDVKNVCTIILTEWPSATIKVRSF